MLNARSSQLKGRCSQLFARRAAPGVEVPTDYNAEVYYHQPVPWNFHVWEHLGLEGRLDDWGSLFALSSFSSNSQMPPELATTRLLVVWRCICCSQLFVPYCLLRYTWVPTDIFAISDPLSSTLPPGRPRVASKVSRSCFWLPWTLAGESHVWDAQSVELAEYVVVYPLPQSRSRSPHVLR